MRVAEPRQRRFFLAFWMVFVGRKKGFWTVFGCFWMVFWKQNLGFVDTFGGFLDTFGGFLDGFVSGLGWSWVV